MKPTNAHNKIWYFLYFIYYVFCSEVLLFILKEKLCSPFPLIPSVSCFGISCFTCSSFDLALVLEYFHKLFFVLVLNRTERLGKNGVEEIKLHRFFKNDTWQWNTIRDSKSAIECHSVFVLLFFFLKHTDYN